MTTNLTLPVVIVSDDVYEAARRALDIEPSPLAQQVERRKVNVGPPLGVSERRMPAEFEPVEKDND